MSFRPLKMVGSAPSPAFSSPEKVSFFAIILECYLFQFATKYSLSNVFVLLLIFKFRNSRSTFKKSSENEKPVPVAGGTTIPEVENLTFESLSIETIGDSSFTNSAVVTPGMTGELFFAKCLQIFEISTRNNFFVA